MLLLNILKEREKRRKINHLSDLFFCVGRAIILVLGGIFMYVEKKKMYHLHRKGTYDKLWVAGNTINNDRENFVNAFSLMGKSFNTLSSFNGDLRPLSNILEFWAKRFHSYEESKMLLNEARMAIDELNLLKRELALEEVRKNFYPDIVSREKAIWLCDLEQLKYWKKALKVRSAFEVEVTGEMFETSDLLLPNRSLNYDACLAAAHDYWKADLTDIPSETYEYLFCGEIKVLKKHR